MKLENEITVNINMSKNDLINLLENDNYKKNNSYIVNDFYYVQNDANLNKNSLDVLSKCIIVRSIDDRKHYIMYKHKEYDENENIIKQGKSKVQVINREDAKVFLETAGYKELIKVVDYIDVYEKDGLEINVEEVNNKYLFIEVEENKKYNSVEKLIQALDNTNIDFDKSNYFVKKAKIIFEDKYR